MGRVVYCRAFYWVVGFSSYIRRAKLGLRSGSSVRAVIGYSHCLDGGGLPY
jgi:hypothetical protein